MVVRSPKCKDLTLILGVFEFERNGYVLELWVSGFDDFLVKSEVVFIVS